MKSFVLQGFDEYMNLVLDDAEEVHLKTKKRRPLGGYMHWETFTLKCQKRIFNEVWLVGISSDF